MKKILLLLLVLCLPLFAQNPTQPDSGRGTSTINGRLGLITNNVTVGNYLQFTSTGIFWNATAGGGSSAAAVTNGFNNFTTASYNIFNGPTKFVGAVTNSGEVFVTSFDSVNKFLLGSGGISNDWGNGLMYSSDGTLSFNYNGRTLNRQSGTTTFDYQNSNINDSSGVASGLFTARVLRDSSNGTSLDWNGFKLEAAGQTELDWNLLKLENNGTDKLDWKLNQMYGTWSNTGDFYVLGQIRGVAGAGNGFVTTTNLTVNGALMLNTNAYATTAYLNAANFVVLPTANGGTYAGIVVDTEGGSESQLVLQSTSANYMNIYNDSSGGTIDVKKTTGSFNVQVGEVQKMSIGNASATYGDSSSYAHTFNGQTFTLAHNANFNSGTLMIPTSSSGTTTNTGNFTSLNQGSFSNVVAKFVDGPSSSTITNNTSFQSINNITASNVVAQTVDGTSVLNSGTNLLMRFIANASAGTIQTEGLFTVRTNTLTAALPLINVIYTNNNLRANVSVNLLFPTGSGAALWTVNGSTTNYYDRKIMTGITTNCVTGLVQPLALYGVSNFIGSAPTPIPGEWNETRY